MNNIINNLRFKVKTLIIQNKDKFPRLYLLFYILAKIQNDRNFAQIIFNLQDFLIIKNYGNDNADKLLYFINIDQDKIGLGAFFRQTVHALYDADRLNALPVIKYEKSCPYFEKDNFKNTDNPFEYYFNNQDIDNIYKSQNVILFKPWYFQRIDKNLGILKNDTDMPIGYKNINVEYLQVLGEIVKKYIKLNSEANEFINKSIEKTFPKDWKNKKILAVHVRGTDFALHWEQHPNIVLPEDFFVAIDDAIKAKGFEYIFLATDDSARLELFKERYKEKLLFFKDVHRSDGTINVTFEKVDRLYNNYLNGLEVLRDMYTMAYCNGFIAGLSQVSVSARIINRSLAQPFEFERIIDKGIFKS